MNKVAAFLLVIGLFTSPSYQAARSYFAPYGTANGDAVLYRNDDEYTTAVTLIGGMDFFGSTRQALYVDNNGIITLDNQLSDYTPSPLSTLTIAAIAPFWADVDTRPATGGYVYYRSTLNVALANSVSAFIRSTQTGSNFQGTRSFVATWENVGYYNLKVNKLNTFQAVLIADDLGQTYCVFNYGDIQWVTGDASGGSNGLGGTPAAIGFSKGSGGIFSELGTSRTANVINVASGTNAYINGVPQTGQYVFSVSDGVVINTCCSSANPPVLSGTPTTLTYVINSINDVPAFTGTVTATYQCTSPSTGTIQPVIFSVFGCPVTKTWSATDACLKTTTVVQSFNYPQVFSDPLTITVPAAYTFSSTCVNPVAPSPSVSGTATQNRGSNGNITYTDSVWTSTTANGCTMTRYWIAADICNSKQYGEQIITIAATPTTRANPLTTRAVTSQQLTTRELTTQAMTTQPLTTQPLTTQPLTTQALTTQPLTTQPLTTQPLTTQELTTQELTTQPLTTQELTTQELTTQELTTQELTTQELTTQELTTQELTTQELTTQELTTQELTTQELTTQELTTQELTTQELTTQELTTQPLTTQPLTTQPLTTQPLTTDFLNTAARCRTYTMIESQGYFCTADRRGYYQCLSGPWASQSSTRPCPAGTSCKCPVGVECSASGLCTLGL